MAVTSTAPSNPTERPTTLSGIDIANSKLIAKRHTRQRRAGYAPLPKPQPPVVATEMEVRRPQTAPTAPQKSETEIAATTEDPGDALEEFPRPQTAPSVDVSMARIKTANLRRRRTGSHPRRSSATSAQVARNLGAATSATATSGDSVAPLPQAHQNDHEDKENSFAAAPTQPGAAEPRPSPSPRSPLMSADLQQKSAASAVENPESADAVVKPSSVPVTKADSTAAPTQGEVERKVDDSSASKSVVQSEPSTATTDNSQPSSSGDTPQKRPEGAPVEYKRALIPTHEERYPTPPKQSYNYEQAMAEAHDEDAIFKPKRRLLR